MPEDACPTSALMSAMSLDPHLLNDGPSFLQAQCTLWWPVTAGEHLAQHTARHVQLT